jgi:hypothetical protein
LASVGALGVLAVACAVGQGGGTDCTTDDLPDPEGKDSNCDGIDGIEADALFVSPDGNDSNPGTKQQPLKTIRTALMAAPQKKKTQILVAGGRYAESDTLNMPDKVGMYGGYDPKSWARTGVETRIEVAKPLAMDARGLTSAVTLARLTLVAADNPAPGGESIGLRVVGVPSFLLSDGVTVIAGRGGAGGPGVAGAAGGGGNPGKVGGGGNVDNQSSPGNGGAPGDNPTCPEAAGGSGGGGGRDPNFAGVKGSDSQLAIQGGPGGSTSSCTPVGGQDGKSASSDGEPGMSGVGGSGAGKLDSMTYAILPQSGTDGIDGKTGAGGGGGGGSSGQTSISCIDGAGNGGGGGGAGGCGGRAGKAGAGGGASIAVLAITSPITCDGATLVTGGGGAGGASGAGGTGGSGSIGGDGGSVGINEIGRGGKGGDGRRGGDGGAGGGGGGGASVGVWSEGGSTPKLLHVSYRLGEGGLGGVCAGGMTCAGQNGIKKESGP